MKKLTPQNLIKAIGQPQKALKYYRANQRSKHFDRKLIDAFFQNEGAYRSYQQEILQSGLIEDLERKLLAYQKRLSGSLRGIPLGTGAMDIYQGIKLYCIIRHLKPTTVVETGVCNGASTSYLLQALAKNQHGKLYSIDYPDVLDLNNEDIWEGKGSSVIPQKGASGWLVPEPLRHRWELILGKSQEELPPLLARLAEIDFFIHDSEHSYECMTFEFETVYPYLRTGGILASHDIDDNTAFQDYCQRLGKEWLLVDDILGFFVK